MAAGVAGKSFSLIQAVENGTRDSQNSRWRFAHSTPPGHTLDRRQQVVVVVPVDAEVDEAQEVGEQHGQLVAATTPTTCRAALQLEHHDGDEDGDDAVAERFQPSGAHRPSLVDTVVVRQPRSRDPTPTPPGGPPWPRPRGRPSRVAPHLPGRRARGRGPPALREGSRPESPDRQARAVDGQVRVVGTQDEDGRDLDRGEVCVGQHALGPWPAESVDRVHQRRHGARVRRAGVRTGAATRSVPPARPRPRPGRIPARACVGTGGAEWVIGGTPGPARGRSWATAACVPARRRARRRACPMRDQRGDPARAAGHVPQGEHAAERVADTGAASRPSASRMSSINRPALFAHLPTPKAAGSDRPWPGRSTASRRKCGNRVNSGAHTAALSATPWSSRTAGPCPWASTRTRRPVCPSSMKNSLDVGPRRANSSRSGRDDALLEFGSGDRLSWCVLSSISRRRERAAPAPGRPARPARCVRPARLKPPNAARSADRTRPVAR